MKCLACRKTIEVQSFYGLHKSCYLKSFKLADILVFDSLDPKKQNSSLEYIKKIKNSFYHGRYRKYSARLGFTTYILKVQEERFPDLPAVEYICNNIAVLLNLNVPEYCLIRYPGECAQETADHRDQTENKQNTAFEQINKKNRRQKEEELGQAGMTFVTRNFMQDCQGAVLHHIYKFLPKGEKNYSCKNIIDILFQQTRPADVAKFVETALFDSLIGNNDRHGRNLGIIESSRYKRLAPMYDNPSYFGIEEDDVLDCNFNISGCIRTSFSKEPNLPDYIKEFQSLGFEKICRRFFQKVIKQSHKIIKEVEDAFISERRKEAFIKFLTKQLKVMEDFKNV